MSEIMGYSPESITEAKLEKIINFSERSIDSDPTSWWVLNHRGVTKAMNYLSGVRAPSQTLVHRINLTQPVDYLIDSRDNEDAPRAFYGEVDKMHIDPENKDLWLRIHRYYPVSSEKGQNLIVNRDDPYFHTIVKVGSLMIERYAYGPNLPMQHQESEVKGVTLPQIEDPIDRLIHYYDV